jgi:hypothetical protein
MNSKLKMDYQFINSDGVKLKQSIGLPKINSVTNRPYLMQKDYFYGKTLYTIKPKPYVPPK